MTQNTRELWVCEAESKQKSTSQHEDNASLVLGAFAIS